MKLNLASLHGDQILRIKEKDYPSISVDEVHELTPENIEQIKRINPALWKFCSELNRKHPKKDVIHPDDLGELAHQVGKKMKEQTQQLEEKLNALEKRVEKLQQSIVDARMERASPTIQPSFVPASSVWKTS